ncbi:MAG: TAXI family TRAP transporter solute-binding subunit [Alphaproteobacteria bacterium]
MTLLTTRRRMLGLLAAAAGAAITGRTSPADELRYFRIGTGGTQGTYFPIGGIIANAISAPPGSLPCDEGGSCGVPGLLAAAQSSSGSVENVRAIGAGLIESGFSQADVAYWAYRGDSMFLDTGAVPNIRAIARLYRESVHLIARSDAGITSVADLAGKRVSLDEEGSGTLVDARAILTAFGLAPADLDARFVKAEKAVDAMMAGELDAFFLISGYPTASVAELAESMSVDLVPIRGAALDDLLRVHPFFIRDFIPRDAYAGLGTVETLSVGALWVVGEAIEADLVYGITKALWHENARKQLDEGHAKGKEIRLEYALQGVPIPLHPGAERYYREVGLIEAL